MNIIEQIRKEIENMDEPWSAGHVSFNQIKSLILNLPSLSVRQPMTMEKRFDGTIVPHDPRDKHEGSLYVKAPPTGTREVVIASYKEPLDWVKDIPKGWKVSVYNALQEPRTFPKGIEPIHVSPNIGREANQWVYHVCKRYNSLADFTLFLQGDKLHCPEYIDSILNSEKLPTFPFRYVGVDQDKMPFPTPLFDHVKALLEKAWLDEPIPEVRPFMVGAQFYVTKKTILNRPLEHYQRLLDAIREPSMWSPAHSLEPVWGCVFKIND